MALLLLRPLSMPLNDDEEQISKKVVYEHQTSSGQNLGAIIAIVVIALALVVFIFLKMR
jgi:small neutral amino acid transporter SnatA (MarC family)